MLANGEIAAPLERASNTTPTDDPASTSVIHAARVSPNVTLAGADLQIAGSLNSGAVAGPDIGLDLMQHQRYERKYLISPAKAEVISREILMVGYLEKDRFTAESPDPWGYLVHSLYLDSPKLITYEKTIQGDPERFKLRIRFYDDDPNGLVFFEIKRRHEGQRIVKSRAQVLRPKAQEFLLNPGAPLIDLDFLPPKLRTSQSHISGLFAFRDLCAELHAAPVAYTSYRRAGFESANDNSERVTIDSDLRSAPFNRARGLSVADRQRWIHTPFKEEIPPNYVCLELKHSGDHPAWMSILVRNHNLLLDSCQKYVRAQNVIDPRHCWL